MKTKYFEKVISWLDRIVETMLFCVVIVMLCAGTAQIFCRYVLNASLSWSEEMMRYLYVWLTMIGSSLAVRRKQFTTIEALYNMICKASPVGGMVLTVAAIVLQIGFFAMLAIYGQQLVVSNLAQVSPAMRISMGGAYFALPLGGYLGIIYCLIELYDRFAKGGPDKT